MGSEKTMQCALVPTENRRISGYAVKIGGVGGGGVPLGALQLIDLWDAFDELRARVAELEAKLEESEDWKNSLANDVIRTSHENMELQAKLAAATKRAGEEPKNG